MAVSVGLSSEQFSSTKGSNGVFGSPPFANRGGSGSTLSVDSTGQIYTYTKSNGTVYTFSTLNYEIILTYVARPDGSWESYTYGDNFDPTYRGERLNSVQTSEGYQAFVQYDSNVTSSYFWWYPSTVTLFDSSVDYCSPSATACSFSQTWPSLSYDSSTGEVTDNLGRATIIYFERITSSGNPSTTYIVPSGGQYPTGETVSVSYFPTTPSNPIPHVSQVAKNNGSAGTWSYRYTSPPLTYGQVQTIVVDPLGQSDEYVGYVEPLPAFPSYGTWVGELASFTDGLSRTEKYSYDSGGRLVSVTKADGDNYQISYDYDSTDGTTRGNVVSVVHIPVGGSTGPTTTYAYDATCGSIAKCNEPNSVTDALGNETDFKYDATTGLMLSKTEPAAPNGIRPVSAFSYTQVPTYAKNSAGQLVQVAAAWQPSQSLTCGATTGTVTISGLATTLSCSGGLADKVIATIAYTGSDHALPTSVTKAAGDNSLSAGVSLGYDPFGNVTVKTDATGASTVTRYDADREIIGVVSADPDGTGPLKNRATRYTYGHGDELPTLIETGTVNSYSDADWANFAALKQEPITYDALGNKLTDSLVTGGATQTLTQYSYDLDNRLQCTAVRMNPSAFASLPASACTLGTQGGFGPDRITELTYNAGGDVATEVRALGVSGVQQTYATYSYINPATGVAAAKLQTEADARGDKTTYIYDSLDRLYQTEYPTPSNGSVSSTTDYEQLTYDADDRVTNDRRRDGQVNIKTYDNLGRLSSISLPQTTYAYDNLAHLASATRTTQYGTQSLSYLYDALGREKSENGADGLFSYQYDLDGRLTQILWPDGFYAGYTLDALGEVTKVTENGATSGPGVLAQFSYDNLGDRVSLSRGNGVNTTYGYDPAFRLASIQHSFPGAQAGNNESLGFSYNPANQRVSRTSNNAAYNWISPVSSTSYAVNGQNQITTAASKTFGYDARGNLTSDGVNTYGYDEANSLISFNNFSVILQIDPADRLMEVAPQSGGQSTTASRWFRYDGPNLLAEYGVVIGQDNGVVHRRYVPGPGVDETLVWYDSADTTQRRWLIPNEEGSTTAVTDVNGAALAINTYDDYGVPAAANLGRIQYTGQKWIPEVGLYDYKARDYSPTLGRFMQTDPVGYKSDLDLYAYAGEDPIDKADPTGKLDVEITIDNITKIVTFAEKVDGKDDVTATYVVRTAVKDQNGQTHVSTTTTVQHFSYNSWTAGILSPSYGNIRSSIQQEASWLAGRSVPIPSLVAPTAGGGLTLMALTPLQTGGHTIDAATARALGYDNRREAGRRLEALKRDLSLPNDHHGTIMSNGDYVDTHTGETLGNLHDYDP